MGKITVTPCDIEGLYVIEPTVFKDERGYFVETYNQNDFREAGLDMVFVQDNQSMSVKGVLRGFITRRNFLRASWSEQSAVKFSTWLWICVPVPGHTENGSAL